MLLKGVSIGRIIGFSKKSRSLHPKLCFALQAGVLLRLLRLLLLLLLLITTDTTIMATIDKGYYCCHYFQQDLNCLAALLGRAGRVMQGPK